MSDVVDFGEWLSRQDLPPTPTCKTWGDLLRSNALHLLDSGEVDTLRAWLIQAIDTYGSTPLPDEVSDVD